MTFSSVQVMRIVQSRIIYSIVYGSPNLLYCANYYSQCFFYLYVNYCLLIQLFDFSAATVQ